MRALPVPDDLPFLPGNHTARAHARLIADREKLTGAHAEAIDVLVARVDTLAREVWAELEKFREILRCLVQDGVA
jgi:hypothetical protein